MLLEFVNPSFVYNALGIVELLCLEIKLNAYKET
jgi:hypothetical protein